MKRISLLVLLLVCPRISICVVPETFTIQGTLESSEGVPLTGIHAYRVGFYDAEIGGSEVSVVTGTVNLSDASRFSIAAILPAVALTLDETWYQLAVDTEDDGIDANDLFSGRVRVHSVPFAHLAADSERSSLALDSEQLGGIPAEDYPTEMEVSAALAGKAATDHEHQELDGIPSEDFATDLELSDALTGKAASDHNHLGESWVGDDNPLSIRGDFPETSIFIPGKEGRKASITIASAPLILDNTASNQSSGFQGPDLLLGGNVGIIGALEQTGSDIVLQSNQNIEFILDFDDTEEALLRAANGERDIILVLDEAGNLTTLGTKSGSASLTKIDHPLDPANKYLVHSSVESPDTKNVYDGIITLNENGEAEVQLPDYFEAFNTDFRYTLTALDMPAPNLYVAKRIKDNQFKIAGGNPNQEISWQVTGIRQDAYAKANPIEVEQQKAPKEKGKYLHPELFGGPGSKSVGLSQTNE